MFRDPTKKEVGYKSFVLDGWNTWYNKERLKEHVGSVDNPHNVAKKKCANLLKREQHIDVKLHEQLESSKNAYFV